MIEICLIALKKPQPKIKEEKQCIESNVDWLVNSHFGA